MAAYKKLTRQRPYDRKYSRLWLADDHLLLATTTGYTEEYRRFYFADIQAIFIRKTNAGAVGNWILVSVVVILIGMGIIFRKDLIFVAFLVALPLVLLTVTALFGSNCTVEIQTAVSTQLLTPLTRLRASKKIIAQLVPLITAAQGETTPEQLATITAGAAATSPSSTIR
jgi:hypothetical protein